VIQKIGHLLLLSLLTCQLWAQKSNVNYDEDKVRSYQLPALLVTENGETIKTKKDWERKRRPELLDLFEKEMFGKSLASFGKLRYKILSSKVDAVEGKATRKEIAIYFSEKSDKHMVMLLYTPNSKKRSPTFLGLNFHGNYTITDEKDIRLPISWVPNVNDIKDNKAVESNRGS